MTIEASQSPRRAETNVVVSEVLGVKDKAVRLLPGATLPPYTYVPGTSTPHPIRHPEGHSYGRKGKTPAALIPERWAENRNFLLAIDLFNFGYYWESHEEWERLWRACPPESPVSHFLKGLVKLAAAGVKVREKSIHGVRRHAASAGEVFADVAAASSSDFYCGLRLTHLQFAADRAAQLPYKEELKPGDPVKVFPFVIEPDQVPME